MRAPSGKTKIDPFFPTPRMVPRREGLDNDMQIKLWSPARAQPPTSVKIPQPGALQEVRGPPKIVMMTSINLVLLGEASESLAKEWPLICQGTLRGGGWVEGFRVVPIFRSRSCQILQILTGVFLIQIVGIFFLFFCYRVRY